MRRRARVAGSAARPRPGGLRPHVHVRPGRLQRHASAAGPDVPHGRPANAAHASVLLNIQDLDVILVSEKDDAVNPVGVKGIGELGNVGTAAAVANAVYHATGVRIRELPIRLEKLLT